MTETAILRKHITTILEKSILLTLSTIGAGHKQPCSCTTYYAFDKDFNLYLWTDPASLHGRNIEKNSLVAVNIFDSNQEWGGHLRGIQMQGKAQRVGTSELVKAGNLYIKRFSKSLLRVKNAKGFHAKIFKSRLYKIIPKKIKVFDNKAFGKEEFRELVV